MAPSRKARRRWGQIVASELNVMPLMNLFIVLIPLLLLSAVFIEVSVIEMNQSTSDEPLEEPQEKPLALAIHISDFAYVVTGNGIPTLTVQRRPELAGNPDGDRVARSQLSTALREVRAAHPDNQNVQIVAQETTHYEEIITVMDISRAVGLQQVGLIGASDGAL